MLVTPGCATSHGFLMQWSECSTQCRSHLWKGYLDHLSYYWIFLQKSNSIHHFYSCLAPSLGGGTGAGCQTLPCHPRDPLWLLKPQPWAGAHCVLAGQVQNVTLSLPCPRSSNEIKAPVLPPMRQYKWDLLLVTPLRSSEHLFYQQNLGSTMMCLYKQSPGLSIVWSLSKVFISVISSSYPFHLQLLDPASCYFWYQSPDKIIYFFMLP